MDGDGIGPGTLRRERSFDLYTRLAWNLSGERPRRYQNLTRPKIVTVNEHKARMKLGVVNLSLVNLPKDTLFFAEFVLRESLALLVFPVDF